MNFKMIRYTLGIILLFLSGFFAIPAVTAAVYAEWPSLLAFLGTAALTVALGVLMTHWRPENTKLYARDGLVIVSLSWIVISLFGSLPFIFSGSITSFVDALFETVSGFTTTGASILPAVEDMPRSINLWRCFTHWVGGMGVLVFVMAILPLSGAENMYIMKAESPGPEVSKLVPRVKKTAIILYAIYIALTVVNVLLLLPEMSLYDAACTAFGTAGTGGFGIYNDSIAGFSPYVQIVVTVFMLIFSVNFNSYYLVLRARFKEAFTSEVITFICIVAAAIAIVTLNLYFGGIFTALGEALRHAAFTVSSLISTTGFAISNFNDWPTLSKTVLVSVMFIGACAGSTGGGFKVSRIVILFKGMTRELGAILRPRQIKKITVDRRPVDHEVVRSVNAYLVTYVLIFVFSVFLISFDNYDAGGYNEMVTNFTAVSAAFNNIGPGLEAVGPTQNFAFFSPFSKLVLIFDMLAGRLELFPMLLLFSPTTWKRSKI